MLVPIAELENRIYFSYVFSFEICGEVRSPHLGYLANPSADTFVAERVLCLSGLLIQRKDAFLWQSEVIIEPLWIDCTMKAQKFKSKVDRCTTHGHGHQTRSAFSLAAPFRLFFAK